MITALIFLLLISIARIWRIRGDDLIIFLYIVLFPMKSVTISLETSFGLISPDNIIALIAIVYLPWKNKQAWRHKLDGQKLNSMIFLLFNIFIVYYVVLKNLFVLRAPEVPTIKTIINEVIFFILFILILKKLNEKSVYLTVEKGILLSSIIIGISIIFANELKSIGLNPDIGKYDYYTKSTIRPTGFLFEDPNVAGMFCIIYFFFILARVLFNRKRNAIYYAALFALFLGIINTGSRASFIALLCSLGLLLISFRKHMKTVSIFFILVGLIGFLVFFYFKFGDPLSGRFYRLNQQGRFSIVSLPRFGYWKIYLNEITKNPEFIVLGNLDPPPINRAPHNYYIMMLYYGGVWIFIAYFALIHRIIRFKNPSSSRSAFPIFHAIVACSICLLALSDPPTKNLALVIAMSSGLMELRIKPSSINARLIVAEDHHG